MLNFCVSLSINKSGFLIDYKNINIRDKCCFSDVHEKASEYDQELSKSQITQSLQHSEKETQNTDSQYE